MTPRDLTPWHALPSGVKSAVAHKLRQCGMGDIADMLAGRPSAYKHRPYVQRRAIRERLRRSDDPALRAILEVLRTPAPPQEPDNPSTEGTGPPTASNAQTAVARLQAFRARWLTLPPPGTKARKKILAWAQEGLLVVDGKTVRRGDVPYTLETFVPRRSHSAMHAAWKAMPCTVPRTDRRFYQTCSRYAGQHSAAVAVLLALGLACEAEDGDAYKWTRDPGSLHDAFLRRYPLT